MKPALLLNSLSHFLIPQSSNNNKARALHLPYLTIFLLVILWIQSFISFSSTSKIGILGYASQISPDEVVRLANEKRASEGLSPLRQDPLLSQAALAKGTDMLNRDYWSHVAPDGTEPWSFFANVGYEYKYAGENLARDFSNPKDAVDAWIASPTHRANMLSPKYNDIGVAVVEGELNGVDTTIIVQLFGTKVGDVAPAVPVAAASSDELVTPALAQEPGDDLVKANLPGDVSYVASFSEDVSEDGFKINPYNLTKAVSLVVVSIVFVALIIDAVVVSVKGIERVSGRPFAHISFIGMVIAIIIIAKAGEIF